MAINVTHRPNGLLLVKNPNLYAGQTDNFVLTEGQKAKAGFFLADNCLLPWTLTLYFTNKLGQNISTHSITFLGYVSFGFPDDERKQRYFVDYVYATINSDPLISQYFNVTYTDAFACPAIFIEIEAKSVGTDYTMDYLLDFNGSPDYYVTEPISGWLYTLQDGIDFAYRTDLIIQCSVQKYNLETNEWNNYTKLKCIPNKDAGSFMFNVSPVLRSILEDTITFINPMPPEYKQFGLFRLIFDEVIAGVPQNNTYTHEVYGLLGASPQPNRFVNTNRFFSNAKAPFITNMPAKARFGRDIYFCNNFANGNIYSKMIVIYQIFVDDVAFEYLYDTKDSELRFGFYKFTQVNYARRYEQLINKAALVDIDLLNVDECLLKIWNQQYSDDGELDWTPGNEIEVIIDLKKYRNNNYFLFANAFGATDTAWLTGELEYQVEIENTKIEFQPVLDADFQQSQFGMYNKKGTHKFKVSTGFKTIAEIQWLLELVFSEKVLWAPLPIWRNLIRIANNEITFEGVDGPIPIIIDKQSISYYKSNGTVNSFSFEFEIASDTFAPIVNLI